MTKRLEIVAHLPLENLHFLLRISNDGWLPEAHPLREANQQNQPRRDEEADAVLWASERPKVEARRLARIRRAAEN